MVEQSPLARYGAEAIGSFVLTSVAVSVASEAFGGLAVGLTLAVLIYAMGSVSGGHFNPLVSIACALSGKLLWGEAIVYSLVQSAAAIVGALSCKLMFGDVADVHPGVVVRRPIILEVIWSLFLCFTVLSVACSKRTEGNQAYGLAIGFTVVSGAYACGPYGAGYFNTAVALGIDVASAKHTFGWSLVFGGFQLVGAALAALLYRVIRAGDSDGAAPSWIQKVICEFYATAMIAITVATCVGSGSISTGIAVGCTLASLCMSVGDLSGCFANPSVTLAVLASGRGMVGLLEALRYVTAQILGGFAGMALGTTLAEHRFPFEPAVGRGLGAAVLLEYFFTFVLCYVVLSTGTSKMSGARDFAGLAIGMSLVTGIVATGPVSGGGLNPAVVLSADALAYPQGNYGLSLAYAMAHLGAGATAAGVFFFTHHAGDYAGKRATGRVSREV